MATEEPDLTPVERALTKVRQAAFAALRDGASRRQVDAEVAQAQQIIDRANRLTEPDGRPFHSVPRGCTCPLNARTCPIHGRARR